MVWAYERYIFGRSYRRRVEQHRRRYAEEWQRFATALKGLDTPWRVGSFVQASLVESRPFRLFELPNPPAATWLAGEGNAADFAALSQEAFHLNGREAYLVTLYQRQTYAPMMCCAIQEEDGGWHQISTFGMFGGYEDLTELGTDLLDSWTFLVARDGSLRVKAFLEREGD